MKIKLDKQSDECIHVIHPLGQGLPLCTYGIKATDHPKLQDFPVCKYKGKCYKEEATK